MTIQKNIFYFIVLLVLLYIFAIYINKELTSIITLGIIILFRVFPISLYKLFEVINII